MKNKPIILISGPSGVGKGSVITKFKNIFLEPTYLSKSVTTRQKRTSEEDGKDYYFWTEKQFQAGVSEGLFLEYMHVHNHFYGTLLSESLELSKKGTWVIIEADVQGVLAIQKKIENTLSVFLLPPSLLCLKERLKNRQTENNHSQKLRLEKATDEIFCISRYDYIITNDMINQTVDELKQLFKERM